MSRFITVEAKFATGTPATFSTTLPSPGFVPTSYRILTVVYSEVGNTLGGVVLQHDRWGPVAIFDAAGTVTGVGGRIDNHVEADLHSGTLSRFTITQRGAVPSTLNGTLTLLIECSRARPPHTH
jgi:hypothetical protein